MVTCLCIFLLVLLTPFAAHAELAVCFDPARPLGSQFQHNPTIDPLKVTDPRCSVVTKASGQTQAQLDLINSTIRGVAASRYLTCSPACGTVGGLAVPMSTAEMDAVDTYLAEQAAAAQVLTDEVRLQDYCGLATLDAVSAKVTAFYDAAQAAMQADVNMIDIAAMQTAIGAITNATTAANITAIKTALTTVAQQVNTTKTALTTVAVQLSNERVAIDKVFRCLLAVRKGAR